jgi:hypothetical protein
MKVCIRLLADLKVRLSVVLVRLSVVFYAAGLPHVCSVRM